jgi:hypothetical protein
MAAKQKKPWHGTGRKARSHFLSPQALSLQAKAFFNDEKETA